LAINFFRPPKQHFGRGKDEPLGDEAGESWRYINLEENEGTANSGKSKEKESVGVPLQMKVGSSHKQCVCKR